ncbi:MAG: hypothetical protein ACRC57_07365 [Sarcina sp.]
MIHNKPIIIKNNSSYVQEQNLNNNMQEKKIRVKVINEQGTIVNQYYVEGNKDGCFGNSLKDLNDIDVIDVNGVAVSASRLENMPMSLIGNVTVLMRTGGKINPQYELNGKTYKLPSNIYNELTNKAAKIYVPNYILNNGTVTSVNINGKQYTGKEVGNYIEINEPINISSQGVNNVIVNINSNKQNEVAQNETTQVIVINQNGLQLSSNNVTNPSGMQLALEVAKQTGQITSVTYNGNEVDLNQLMNEGYQQGSDNLMVITEYTEPPINLYFKQSTTWNGQVYSNTQSFQDANELINSGNSQYSTGAVLNLPPVLIRRFNINSVTIDNVTYQGYIEGNKYIINEPIAFEPVYDVVINGVRK